MRVTRLRVRIMEIQVEGVPEPIKKKSYEDDHYLELYADGHGGWKLRKERGTSVRVVPPAAPPPNGSGTGKEHAVKEHTR